MRVLMLDLDTLRPDHLGCYGYLRNTSPTLDSICADGMRFDNYHCSDAPCLPSRAALSTGMYGIHNFAINHGNATAELRTYGQGRGFKNPDSQNNLFNVFRKAGMYTASVSSFAERHSSYWFDAGFNEIINCGQSGQEIAEDVSPLALDWLERNKDREDWFLHIHFWDPHTPYRTPAEFGNPFENEPIPDWFTQELVDKQQFDVGPHCAREVVPYGQFTDLVEKPRHIASAETVADVKKIFDGYDCGVRYMDDKIADIIQHLKDNGIYEDTAIIITADHGENLGELGIYAEHGSADEITTRIPMIIKWPGMKKGIDKGLHVNIDLAPTIADMFNISKCTNWDGESYAKTLQTGEDVGREYLVVSQCAHVCQRAVRFDKYIYIRTYNDGFHLFPDEMLFDLEKDFQELNNIAKENPDICAKACRYLVDWMQQMMLTSRSDVDPMWTVIRENGPFHAPLGQVAGYYEVLKKTNRADSAEELKARYPQAFIK